MIAAVKRAGQTTKGLLLLGHREFGANAPEPARDICAGIVEVLQRTSRETVAVSLAGSGVGVAGLERAALEQIVL